MQFLKLTYRYAEDEDAPLWVRADSVISIHRTWVADDDEGTNKIDVTRIMAGASEYWVQETPEQILSLIHRVGLGY